MAKTSTNVRYVLHAAVLLLAQLHCMVKLKYSKFVSLHVQLSILSFHLNEEIFKCWFCCIILVAEQSGCDITAKQIVLFAFANQL